jgi:hypothetical protein
MICAHWSIIFDASSSAWTMALTSRSKFCVVDSICWRRNSDLWARSASVRRAVVTSSIAWRNTRSACAMPAISSCPPTATATLASPSAIRRMVPLKAVKRPTMLRPTYSQPIKPALVSATMLRRIRMIRPSLICEIARAESASAIVPWCWINLSTAVRRIVACASAAA